MDPADREALMPNLFHPNDAINDSIYDVILLPLTISMLVALVVLK